MSTCIPAAITWALLAWVTPRLAQGPQAQTQTFEARLERALAALDSTETERGVDSLLVLLASPAPAAPRAILARAHLHLAAASWALGFRDSAAVHLRDAVRANPFAVPDPDIFNPDIVAAFRQARRSVRALDLRVASDTVLQPATDKYLVAVAVGEAQEVTVLLVGPSPDSGAAVQERMRVDSSSAIPVTPWVADSSPIGPGSYSLIVRDGFGLEVSTQIEVRRILVDTLEHEPPLDPLQFRAENRPGPPEGSSVALGLFLGATAAFIPQMLSNRNLSGNRVDAGAVSVGSGIALAGIVGAFVGRRPIPIAENVEFNRQLRASWEQRNQAIAGENARRRRWAPLRIVVTPQ